MEEKELWGGKKEEEDPEKQLKRYKPPENDPQLEEELLKARRDIQRELGIDDDGGVVENGEGDKKIGK